MEVEDRKRRHSQYNGCDGEELARGGELHTVIHLLPVGEKPSLALIRGLKRRPLYRVQQEIHTLQTQTRTHTRARVRYPLHIYTQSSAGIKTTLSQQEKPGWIYAGGGRAC